MNKDITCLYNIKLFTGQIHRHLDDGGEQCGCYSDDNMDDWGRFRHKSYTKCDREDRRELTNVHQDITKPRINIIRTQINDKYTHDVELRDIDDDLVPRGVVRYHI